MPRKRGSARIVCTSIQVSRLRRRTGESEALAGTFRSDLYYRLTGFTLTVPPLRERREDIVPLAHGFVLRASRELGINAPSISDDATATLLDYAWPGNVRELRNVIERALVLAEGQAIRCEHLRLDTVQRSSEAELNRVPTSKARWSAPAPDLSPKELSERTQILAVLAECAGNQCKAAEKLGVSRSTLLNRLDVYRIGRPRKRPG